jgi:hypothetical protein
MSGFDTSRMTVHVVLPLLELAALLEVLPAAVDGDEDREIPVPF